MSMRWLTGSLHNHKKQTVLCVLAVSALIALSGCSVLPKESAPEQLPQIHPPKLAKKPIYTVKTATLETTVSGSGKIMSKKEQGLYFELDNRRVKSVKVHTGEKVKKGQLIAALDVSDLDSQVTQQKLQNRQNELQLIQTLRKAGSMSAAELEQAKINFELQRQDLVKLEKQIEQAQITAPYDGTIVSLNVKPGDSVSAYQQVGVIADMNELTVAASFSQSDLKEVSAGMPAAVTINGAGQFQGTVERLPTQNNNQNNNRSYGGGMNYGGGPSNNRNSQIDSVDQYLIVTMDKWPDKVRRGTPLSVSIVTQKKKNAVVVPPSCVHSYSGRNYVEVQAKNGDKREVDVEVGQQTATEVEIVKGLTPGQKVVGQ